MKEISFQNSPNQNELNELLRDPIIVQLVTIVNLSSLSILEMLEYGISHHDVNQALANGVIQFEKSPETSKPSTSEEAPHRHTDLYFKYLTSKLKLTDLGIYILETISRDPLPLLSENDPSFSREESGLPNLMI